jgi:Carbonic anhydrases/acetyltransferases, isoleucine patch superfamily
MFHRIALQIKTRKDQKELLAACTEKPQGLVTFGKVTAKWGIKVDLGDKVTLGANTVFYGNGFIKIGSKVVINDGGMFYASKEGGVSIGEGTMIGPYCVILDTDHGIKKRHSSSATAQYHHPSDHRQGLLDWSPRLHP